MTDIVVGTGPSGLSAIMALLKKGRQVTVLDAGQEPETKALARIASLASRAPEAWDPAEISNYTAAQRAAGDDIMRFGSRFAVASPEKSFADGPLNVAVRASRAKGGLSNVWGAAVLPWPASEIANWPIPATALQPHYRAVAEFMPIAGVQADYDAHFGVGDLPLRAPLPPSAQGNELLSRFSSAKKALGEFGMAAGPARQAVTEGCRQCGMCLFGCPYDLIFSSRPYINKLIADGRISYRRGEIRRIEEHANGVVAHFSSGLDTISGDRLFLATGVLETARITLASEPALADRAVTLSESAHFFTPTLSRWRAPGTGKGPHHTLVQAMLEMKAADVSPHLVHTQLYGWNDFYARELAASYGFGIDLFNPIFDAMARRLIVAQTFLHSDHCPKISLSLAKSDPEGRLKVQVVEAAGFHRTVRQVRRRLASGLRKSGLYAISMAGRTGAPGSSFHLGGSFPMCETPSAGQTDTLGRPAGRKRIHIVDGSVMPDIPASTITFSVMANAHRIATMA